MKKLLVLLVLGLFLVTGCDSEPQQIERARKLLQDLPEKEDRKTRLEAAELLERDFRKAKEKGYNPRELSQMLKNEGIIIPAYLIKRFFAENGSSSTPQK